jgi:putative copper export protein
MNEFLAHLGETGIATAIRESAWMFPTLETVHVLGIAFVVGSISMVDLRLIHLYARDRSVTEMLGEVLPWTWGGFVVAVTSGLLMFISKGAGYWESWTFRAKAVLLLAAGLNMLCFHLVTARTLREWDTSRQTPIAARIGGGLSLLLWISVVVFGRWTGFV